MSVISRIVRMMDGVFGSPGVQPYRQVGNPSTATQRDIYRLLRLAYYANGMYDELHRDWRTADDDAQWAATKELRNLHHAVVEAYVALVWPGALPDALPMLFPEQNPRAGAITERIHEVWHWSNWGQKKQLFVRHQAMLGNAFLYVASRPGPDGERADRVYFHLPDPEHVTDLDTDERGYLTYIRFDVPVRDRERPDEPYVETTEWWKARDLYRRWETPLDQYDPDRLGTPIDDLSMRAEFGIDFVPVVHAKAIDTGETYGMSPSMPALEKLHELNRKATAFSQQLYRHGKPDKVIQGSGGQAGGNYAPPPPINVATASQKIEVAGETMWSLPPGWTLENLVANLPYASHMAGIDQDIDHLASSDLPELNWYRIAQSGNDASGRALRTLLKPAIAKIEEARGNAETALARANAMALTIAQKAELDGFSPAEIGTYEAGDFDHTFAARSVVPEDDVEKAEAMHARVQAAAILIRDAMLEPAAAFRLAGFKADEVEQAMAAIEETMNSGIDR